MTVPTVLVVDDHEVVRRGCADLLTSRGVAACYQADSLTRACRLLAEHRPDVVVLAWPLDGRPTLSLIRRVRAHAGACPIVLYTSHAGSFTVMDALRAGAAGFVTKASPPDILIEGVQRVFRGGHYISPDIAQRLALSKSARLTDPIGILSPRERAVFELIVAGSGLAQAATRLTLSRPTVANYLTRVKRKLGVDSVADLVRIDVCRKSVNRRGMDPPDPYSRDKHPV